MSQFDRRGLARLYIQHGEKQRKKKQKEIEELKEKDKCRQWIEDVEKGKSFSDNQESDEEYLKAYLRKLCKKPTNKRSWSLISLKGMSEIVGEPYECYYHFVYWSLSNLTHPSTLGGYSYYDVSYPSDEFGETGKALQISFDCYCNILSMVDKIFELRFEEEINQFARRYINLIN